MSLGLFDVVGPVMHGPSSNHTGGANRIGYAICKLMGGCPGSPVLLFHPAYMKSYKGQATHTAMVAGCLGFREYDEESTDSLRRAKESGIDWCAKAYEPARSRNVMGIEGEINGKQYRIIADSIGGGSIVIYDLNGIPVELTGNEYVKVFYTENETWAANTAAFFRETGACKVYSGIGFDGRAVVCVASAKPIEMAVDGEVMFAGVAKNREASAADFAAADNAASTASMAKDTPAAAAAVPEDLNITALNPLYTFSDKGHPAMLTTFAEILNCTGTDSGRDLADTAIRYEMARSEVTEEQVMEYARFMVNVVRASLAKGSAESLQLLAGLADPGDGKRILHYARSGKTLLDPMFSLAMARAAILAEMNGSACRIVASPTGGAAGTLPAVIITVGEHLGCDDDTLAKAFLVAALTGVIMGQKASFSGTVGGCQAEVGIGAAMGAAAVTWMAGGSTEACIHGAALTIKNLLGLSCDPPAPCTEIPCIKRNAMGVAAVFFGTELALAGVKSAIDPDDVVSALADTQKRLPTEIKFGGTGGLAGTPSGKALREKWQEKQE